MLELDHIKIAVIGLGYVGLPLATEFGKLFPTLGFDIDSKRVAELSDNFDRTNEVTESELQSADKLTCTADESSLKDCNVFIVTVPTPIDEHKRPDLSPLVMSSTTIANYLSRGDLVIYESTVYPGTTEEECVPVLESVSGLKFNEDFFVGYSPERINPGDKQNRINTIVKVTSGSTVEVAEFVNQLYSKIITAGTFKASSIRVAEAAKVIENTQRDINIALMNELAIIFNKLGIDTKEVLAAAGTKWNFLPFKPGLVGGHCIGVDPYYLTHKAQAVGYHPNMILSGRRINDGMGVYVANQMIKAMIKADLKVNQAKVLILGISFKENCPDIRNTRVVDVIDTLKEYGIDIEVYDPWVSVTEVREEYNLELINELGAKEYDGIMLAVGHDCFKTLDIASLCKQESVVFDLKAVLPDEHVSIRL